MNGSVTAPEPAGLIGLLRRVVPLWLGFGGLFALYRWPFIANLRQADPDDTLRLVQVRDLLAGQGWFDLHQYRAAPPDGVVMHWSRLVDLPLAAVELALRPLLGTALAEQAASVIVPLLTFGLILLGLAWIVRRQFGAGLIGYAVILTATSFPVATQILPTRVDHHGWQIAAVVLALMGFVTDNPRKGGTVAGIALALGMAISLELLPLAALFGAVLAYSWIRCPSAGIRFQYFIAALFSASLAAFALTRGPDVTNYCDAVSPAYLAALGTMALGTLAVARLAGHCRIAIGSGLALSGLAAIAMIMALAPQCSTGPFAALDPLLQSLWYHNVLEGAPVWHLQAPAFAQWVVPPLVGLYAAVRLCQARMGNDRRLWCDFALLIAGSFLLGSMVLRSMAFCIAMAVVPLAWWAHERVRRLENHKGVGAKLTDGALLLAAVMPALPVYAVQVLISPSAHAAATPFSGSSDGDVNRDLPLAAAALSRLPKGTALAPLDEGPLLLLHTPHSVVATGHHRGAKAMHDVMTAFLVDPPVARYIMDKHGVRYVVLHPKTNEVDYYRTLSPNGFAAQLSKGQAPDWLEPVAMPRESGLSVWKVR